MNKEILEKLVSFLEKDKFNDLEWNNRGLNPSSSEICDKMRDGVNKCCSSLILLIEENKSKQALKRALKKGLKSFRKLDFDTEEKEFICDNFHELSKIVNVDFKDDLNKWLYGSFLIWLMKITEFIKGREKVIDTLSQECTACNAKLETFITKKDDKIFDYYFEIVKCNFCGEFNLMDRGANIKNFRKGEYEFVEFLKKEDYSFEDAKQRLEQIKLWRK